PRFLLGGVRRGGLTARAWPLYSRSLTRPCRDWLTRAGTPGGLFLQYGGRSSTPSPRVRRARGRQCVASMVGVPTRSCRRAGGRGACPGGVGERRRAASFLRAIGLELLPIGGCPCVAAVDHTGAG